MSTLPLLDTLPQEHDKIYHEAQRQGRIPFYLSSAGEEVKRPFPPYVTHPVFPYISGYSCWFLLLLPLNPFPPYVTLPFVPYITVSLLGVCRGECRGAPTARLALPAVSRAWRLFVEGREVGPSKAKSLQKRGVVKREESSKKNSLQKRTVSKKESFRSTQALSHTPPILSHTRHHPRFFPMCTHIPLRCFDLTSPSFAELSNQMVANSS